MNPKSLLFRAARAGGVTAAFARSRWRRERLLILCYHGVSLGDEHVCDPALYVSPARLRERLQQLRDGGYAVVPLAEGLRRLAEGTLPPASVAITFDDGTRDFAEVAVPLLREYSAPATVYLTTYYCFAPMPVFNTALRYILWRGRDTGADVGGVEGGPPGPLPVATAEQRDAAWRALFGHATARDLDAVAKDALLRRVAERVGVDYDAFLKTGMFQQMTPDQVRALPRDLVDVQLHTHRHRTPRDRALFVREIEDNRRALAELAVGDPTHFCYPSGDYWGEFLGWLRELRVATATTCVPGLASRASDPLLLPRFLDDSRVSGDAFEAWASGLAEVLPRRAENRLRPERLRQAGAETPAGAR
jgi:peptidoglycan/xylan/chitin deacetylase (PgdA/CDA1 family)